MAFRYLCDAVELVVRVLDDMGDCEVSDKRGVLPIQELALVGGDELQVTVRVVFEPLLYGSVTNSSTKTTCFSSRLNAMPKRLVGVEVQHDVHELLNEIVDDSVMEL